MKMVFLCFISWIGISLVISAEAAQFSVSSPELKDGSKLTKQLVFNGFGCNGGNISPKLVWSNSPPQTQSYAVTVYDPDAPTGSGWWHWVVFNIPKDVNSLETNAGNEQSGLAPNGSVQSRTDFGTTGYGGACPPAGDDDHRYIFTVHALDTKQLDLDKNVTAAMVGYFIGQHSLAKAELTGTYSR